MKKTANMLVLVGALIGGAAGMRFWDHSVQQFQQRLVDKELAQQKQAPAVDVHKIGFHGEWADPSPDGLEPTRSAEEMAKIEMANKKAAPVFATPGGAYTKDDIVKNGNIQPYARFHRYQFLYSMTPFPGEPLDPITATKTSPAFGWYVGGKLYHFASIASLEEFVLRAKTEPGPIPPPEDFITKGTKVKEEKS